MGKIKSEHRKILDMIRACYIQSGGTLPYNLEDLGGLNEYYKSSTNGYEVSFDYGIPKKLYTPEGSYTILGSSLVGDTEKFWELLNETFEVEIIQPKCDDAKDYLSGPIIKIKEYENGEKK